MTSSQPPQSRQPSAPIKGADSPRIPVLLAVTIGFSAVLLLLVGGSLFCFPTFAQHYWVWELAPYNTRFLGATYLAAMIPLVLTLRTGHWAPARLVLPMLWLFTTQFTVLSWVYFDQFNPLRRATAIWFALYHLDCLVATIFLLWLRRPQPVLSHRLPRRWQWYLPIQGLLLLAYGAGLLVAPDTFSAIWPWPIDAFHSRLYSAIFLAGAIGSWGLSVVSTGIELFMLGITQSVFSILVLVGVVVVDRVAGKINWLLPSNWVWMGIFAILGGVGLAIATSAFKPVDQPSRQPSRG